MASEIMMDKRPITGAWSLIFGNDDEEPTGATVGHNGVSKIEPYEENGEMSPVVWLRVWKGGHLHARLRVGAMAEITYKKPVEQED